MKTSNITDSSASCVSRSFRFGQLATVLGFAALVFSASTTLLAQAPDSPDARRRGGGGDRGNFNPQDMQARMLAAVRERLEVTDDEEWKVISERIAKVSELRRSTGGGFGGMMGGRGGPPGGGDRSSGKGGDRTSGRGGNSPELAALAAAVRDKLPDAEIKSRLERLREKRREGEAALAKAQEELRAVLTIRQEAVAVMFGLLP